MKTKVYILFYVYICIYIDTLLFKSPYNAEFMGFKGILECDVQYHIFKRNIGLDITLLVL